MKIPTKVKVGPYEIDVKIVDNSANNIKYGWVFYPKELKIELESYFKKRHGEIFIHEVIEAINDIYNLSIKHDDMMVLGVALYQLLQDNAIKLHL